MVSQALALRALAVLQSAGTHRLRAFDLALVAVYLVGITLFGLRFRKRSGTGAADKSLRSYFLANNTIPWWAISLSIVSAETSTLTIISIPGVAFAGDFGFLQVVIGYMIGRIVVAGLFLPTLFCGRDADGLSADRSALWRVAAQGHGGIVSADAGGGRGCAGVCGFDCGGNCDRDSRCAVDWDYLAR